MCPPYGSREPGEPGKARTARTGPKQGRGANDALWNRSVKTRRGPCADEGPVLRERSLTHHGGGALWKRTCRLAAQYCAVASSPAVCERKNRPAARPQRRVLISVKKNPAEAGVA